MTAPTKSKKPHTSLQQNVNRTSHDRLELSLLVMCITR